MMQLVKKIIEELTRKYLTVGKAGKFLSFPPPFSEFLELPCKFSLHQKLLTRSCFTNLIVLIESQLPQNVQGLEYTEELMSCAVRASAPVCAAPCPVAETVYVISGSSPGRRFAQSEC